MTDQFSNLTKIPNEPAAKLLAQNNMVLDTKLSAPASASVEAVLTELSQAEDAGLDMLRLFCAILPARERVWWSCLAARDIVGEGVENETRLLKDAEAWVFRPTEENRAIAVANLEHADLDDKGANCALGVMYCDGTLGPGELAEHPAPHGAAAIAAFVVGIQALAANKDKWDEHLQTLIGRALDIARGGNGKGGKT